jgi:hypothetical protein
MANAKASKQAKPYKNNMCNLPQDVKHEFYPKQSFAVKDNGKYPDDLNMIDANQRKDSQKLMR